MDGGGGGGVGESTVRKMNEEEDEQILQGVNEKMRRKEGEKEEIPSSGFSLKPLVKVNEGCVQSSETDYITAPLISSVSMHLSLHAHECGHVHVWFLCFNTCATVPKHQPGMSAPTQSAHLCAHMFRCACLLQ